MTIACFFLQKCWSIGDTFHRVTCVSSTPTHRFLEKKKKACKKVIDRCMSFVDFVDIVFFLGDLSLSNCQRNNSSSTRKMILNIIIMNWLVYLKEKKMVQERW